LNIATPEPSGDDRLVAGRSTAFLIVATVVVGGCSLHHAESPQQQFMEAVERGNSAQASQIWLNMSGDDRASFAHSVGFKPQTSPADVMDDLERRQQAAEAEADPENGGNFMGDAQTVEYPGLDTDLNRGSLQNLPNLQTTSGSTSSVAEDDAY
jgi:hypothetical protein